MGVMSDYFSQITRKTTCLKITESKSEIRGGGGGGGYSREFLVGRMVLQILIQFQTKEFSFSTLVFRPGKKTILVFRPGAGRNYVIIT